LGRRRTWCEWLALHLSRRSVTQQTWVQVRAIVQATLLPTEWSGFAAIPTSGFAAHQATASFAQQSAATDTTARAIAACAVAARRVTTSAIARRDAAVAGRASAASVVVKASGADHQHSGHRSE
tara:strand:+ start:44921 stop:45292 length:372 start_codon:yes stop_codon:yes gene_type:complete